MGRTLALIGVLIFFFTQSEASAAQQAANEPQQSLVKNQKPARAVLYDEDPSNPKGKQYVGSVIWHIESVKNNEGKPDDVAVTADIDIPERRFKMTMSFHRNTDISLPASHTAELTFVLPQDFDNGTVANVPGVLMKSNEQARGTPLAGLVVKVTDGAFLVGLSNDKSDRSRNLQLLRDRSWFDVPLVYSNKRRAVIAIEKGVTGERAFTLVTKTFPSTENTPSSDQTNNTKSDSRTGLVPGPNETIGTPDSRQSESAANEPQHLSERASIDCIKVATQSTNTVARVLCSGRDGATADWDLNSTLWALNGSGNAAQTKVLDQDQQHWRDALNRSCMLPKDSPAFSPQQKKCVLDGLHKRATALRSGLSGDALAESRLTPEQHAGIQKLLIDRGLLKGRADGEFRSDTRQAIRTFQEAEGSTPTGFLSQDQLSHLRSNGQPPPSQKSAQSSKTLTPSELDLLRARLTEMWNVQSNQERPEELIVDVRIHLGRDRRLSATPEVVSQGSSPRYQAAANAAVLAVIHAQPYDMLTDNTYDQWKDMIVTFDPRQMFNGGSENNARARSPDKITTAQLDARAKAAAGEQHGQFARPTKTDILGFRPGMLIDDVHSRIIMLSNSRECSDGSSTKSIFPCAVVSPDPHDGPVLYQNSSDFIYFDWSQNLPQKTAIAVRYNFHSPKFVQQMMAVIVEQFNVPPKQDFSGNLTWHLAANLELVLSGSTGYYTLSLIDTNIPKLDEQARLNAISASPNPKF